MSETFGRDKGNAKLVKLRDSVCQRCAQSERLEAHHIVAFADDGDDDITNMIALCHKCHKEWHSDHEGSIAFMEWLTAAPPMRVMRAAMLHHPELALTSVREAWSNIRPEVIRLETINVRSKTWTPLAFAAYEAELDQPD